MENHAERVHQKIVPDSFLVLVINLKEPLYVRIFFKKIRYFERRLSKNFIKVNLNFSFKSSKIMKNKRNLELMTCHCSGYKTSSEKILY